MKSGLFNLTDSYEGVLTSGVRFSLRELLTGDQAELQKRVRKGDRKAFVKMLADCLLSVGDNRDINVEFVESMLSNDIAYAFIKLRQHTFRNEEIFKFKNEFPLEPGENEKHLEDFEVKFTEEFFKTRPYIWVVEEMARLEEDFRKHNPDEEYVKLYDFDFPEMFETYEQLIETQKEREFLLEKAGVTIHWFLLDGSSERKRKSPQFAKKDELTLSLDLRAAYTMTEVKNGDQTEEIPEAIEWEKVPMYYSDKFRQEFMRVEGSVDTMLAIRSELKPAKVDRINLVQTLAFFAPSLGT